MFLREDEEITTTDTWTNAQVMKVVATGIFAFSPQLGSYLSQQNSRFCCFWIARVDKKHPGNLHPRLL